MFYEEQNYKILSEHMDPYYGHIAHITAWGNEEPADCPLCGSAVKKHSIKIRRILDYNEEKGRVEKIELKYRKYVCKESSCRHTFLSGGSPDKASHTKAFDRYLAVSLITDKLCSLTEYGKMFSLSHTTVSDIVCSYAKELNPHFAPPPTSCVLYLHPFLYRNKKRFYLGAVDIYGNHILLDFFGYKDAKKELLDYFRFHWKHEEYPYAPVEVVTEMNTELFGELEKMFVYPAISVSAHFLDQWLNQYKKDSGDGTFHQICMLVNRLKTQLGSSEMDTETLYQWWNEQDKELRNHLDELWNTLTRRLDECLGSHLYKNISFSAVNILINRYNSGMMPFAVMATRLLYLFHGSIILLEEGKEPDSMFCFDAKTGIRYRTIPPYGSEFGNSDFFVPNMESPDQLFDFDDNFEVKFDEELQKLLTELPF